MMIECNNKSEVARLRQQIAEEYASVELALRGPATVARHVFITVRMENIGKCVSELAGLIGAKEAAQVLEDI